MGVFVADFAKQRGMTVQGVYKAIKRHNIPTQQGVINGKSAQFMTDEDATRLNEILGPPEASNLILANQLQVQIANRENELISERERKVEELLREKEVEMTKTRELMLSRINEISSDMQGVVGTIRSAYEKQDREKSDRITALEAENRALNDKVAQLQETNRELLRQLSEAQEHPYKNLKASWDKKKEAKKNGTPAKDNA